ncbi:MAG: type II toxin-antitoxin system RelE/ParE family toxin [Candidatus Pacebacteria bacterium]|nr:type II toxin-antitoxin system RelE/ParE family toxin [Candidatus Paceibacterota bacterium]
MARDVFIIYSPDTRKDLLRLEKRVALRIVHKIAENAELPDPLVRAKPLAGVLAGKYRYRIGDYRVIFILDAEGRVCILTILRIKHRKDVYR